MNFTRLLAIFMVFTIVLACNSTSYVAKATENTTMSEVTFTETNNAEVATSSGNEIIPLADEYKLIKVITGNTASDEVKFRFGGIFGTWIPYINIQSGGANFCVHVAIYDPNGTLVCSHTFNVVDSSMDNQPLRIGNVELSKLKTYTFKINFDRQTTVGIVTLYGK